MAEVDVVPTFGVELKDGFKLASAWAGHGIAWLDEIQQFYRERAAIEKEYSAKLSTLAKKYFEKKNRKISILSVGDTPSMTPGSLERFDIFPLLPPLHPPLLTSIPLPSCSASLTTWSTQLTTLESRAAAHDTFGNNLITQVADPLKFYGGRYEELRKQHIDYAEKLERERESSYADLRKAKGKYDAACQEVEARRKKSESHYDKAKAQSAYQQQVFEMNNAKNSYLIAITVTNSLKNKYYHEYVPELMDSLQDLNEFRVLKLNGLWELATGLESHLMKTSQDMMDNLIIEIKRNSPHLDSMMYMRHNMDSFSEPPDKTFEPSPVWHDDGAMITDEMAIIYLRNLLGKSKSSLGDLKRDVDKKRRDVESARRVKQRVREGTEKKDEVEVVRTLFNLQEDLHSVDRKRLTAEVETSTITTIVGDVTLGAKNHNFKSQTFKIPTNCDLCGERIWGLSAKGFDCRDCGYTCHNKCEMKVPADCPGEQNKDERKKLKAQRQSAANKLLAPVASQSTLNVSDGPELSRSNTTNTMNSLSSREAQNSSANAHLNPPEEAAPRVSISSVTSGGAPKRRIMAPPPAAYITGGPPLNGGSKEEKRGKMLYAFEGGGDGELAVGEGRDITMIEEDDGSGWIKVRAGAKEGLVPAAYADWTPVPAAPPVVPMATRPVSTYSTSTTSSTATSTPKKKQGPAVAPKRGARKLRYVEALYGYTAQSESEHTMEEGERFVLVKDDSGDGWVEVEKAGVTASVPANYVQIVP
ncbi:formin-binding protein 1 [Geosmithia morbida]|uniref:Protein BZZ1 n=1 Tax=Geosmithia morbida TaxID=1094350 RepID=A0A9P4YQ82_9HYPO|nr:formin-binding protein 1 [Geosmithia morbida]KAF4120025.1 formin-binding protein 1 [Geosmithia morbida]